MTNDEGRRQVSIEQGDRSSPLAAIDVAQIELHRTHAGSRFTLHLCRFEFPLTHRFFNLRIGRREPANPLQADDVARWSYENLKKERSLEVHRPHQVHAHVDLASSARFHLRGGEGNDLSIVVPKDRAWISTGKLGLSCLAQR